MKTSGGRACGRPIAAIARSKPAAVSFAASRVQHVGHEVVAAADVAGRRAAVEVLPRAVDPRQPVAQVRGQQEVLRPRSTRSARRASSRSGVARRGFAHSRSGHRSVIGSTTVSSWLRRNSVKRLRGWSRVVGIEPRSGRSPVSCAGTASGGQVVHGGGVAVPGRVAGEAREVGEQRGVDRAVRRCRSSSRAARRRPPARSAWRSARGRPWSRPPRPAARARCTGEPSRKSSTTITGAGERTVRKERTGAARAYSGGGAPRRPRPPRATASGRSAERPAERRQHERGHEQRDERQQRRAAERRAQPAERPHERRAGQRRHERVAEREQEDVGAGAVPRDEELRVAPEQIEERLGEGERPQPAEVQRGAPEADRRARSCAPGRRPRSPRSRARARLVERARRRHGLAALDVEALREGALEGAPPRSRGSRRRACRRAASAPSGRRGRGTRSPRRRRASAASRAAPARGRCP